MSPISRGFHRRHEEAEPAGRVPPGQYVTHDFPVLSAGPTPHTPLERWTFSIEGGSTPASWTWQEFQALPAETVTVDIHCVTRWSKLDTMWKGVSLDVLLDAVALRLTAGYAAAAPALARSLETVLALDASSAGSGRWRWLAGGRIGLDIDRQ